MSECELVCTVGEIPTRFFPFPFHSAEVTSSIHIPSVIQKETDLVDKLFLPSAIIGNVDTQTSKGGSTAPQGVKKTPCG